MAETTGLLNRRTGNPVPRVRISSSPRNAINSDRCSAKAEHFCFRAQPDERAGSHGRMSAETKRAGGSPIAVNCSRTPEIALPQGAESRLSADI